MKIPWRSRNTLMPQRTTLLDRDANDDSETYYTARPRSRVIQEPMTIHTILSNAWSPFENLDDISETADIENSTLEDLEDGMELGDLIKSHPDDVLTVLEKVSVAPLGTMEAKDSQVLAAFGNEKMLTCGHDTPHNDAWKSTWRNVLQKRGGNEDSPHCVGWNQNVTLGAYVVNVADIAKRKEDADLLGLLLLKHASGAAPGDIWEFPAVQAVIDYHWQHWAKRALSIIFGFFLIWILCFFVYGILYVQYYVPKNSGHGRLSDAANATQHLIERDEVRFTCSGTQLDGGEGQFTLNCSNQSNPFSSHVPTKNRSTSSSKNHKVMDRWLRVLNVICFAMMCPFAVEEIRTLLLLGVYWCSIRNFVDAVIIGFQIIIFLHNFIDYGCDWYGYCIAVQIILLSIRLLRFVKLLSGGATFLDSALAAIYSTRYLLIYVIFTGFAASIALAAIYRTDDDFNYKNETFNTYFDSIVTTFHIMFSGFKANYVFDSKQPTVIFFFFLGFHIVSSVAILNLIIASMTNSYASLSCQEISQDYMSRADLIDELQSLYIPKFMIKEMPHYVHFLIVEKQTVPSERRHSVTRGGVSYDTSFKISEHSDEMSLQDLRKQLSALTKNVEEMIKRENLAKRRSFKETGHV